MSSDSLKITILICHFVNLFLDSSVKLKLFEKISYRFFFQPGVNALTSCFHKVQTETELIARSMNEMHLIISFLRLSLRLWLVSVLVVSAMNHRQLSLESTDEHWTKAEDRMRGATVARQELRSCLRASHKFNLLTCLAECTHRTIFIIPFLLYALSFVISSKTLRLSFMS